jgi:Hint domain
MTDTTLDGSGTPYTIQSETTQVVADGDRLLLLGTIQNAGTIFVDGTGGPFVTAAPTALSQLALVILESPAVTLTGGGTVLLSGTDPANIGGSTAAPETLVNVDNTILGSGYIGAPGQETVGSAFTLYPINFVNLAGGVVDATGTIAESGTSPATFVPPEGLFITTADAPLINDGLLEATGIGGLYLEATTIDQSGGGTILANGVGVGVSIGGSGAVDLVGGTLETTNGGTIQIQAFQGGTLDGSVTPLVIDPGTDITVNILDSGLDLMGTIVNRGTLSGGPFFLASPTVALTGGGEVLSPIIVGQGDTLATLINADTIVGTGEIGIATILNGIYGTLFSAAPVHVINLAGGVIDASGTAQSGGAYYVTGDGIDLFGGGTTLINNGILEATGVGGMDIANTTIDQTGGGSLLAIGAGVNVYLQSVNLIGGTIETFNGGTIDFNGGTNTLASNGSPIVINAGGVLEVSTFNTAGTLTVQGSTIDNHGTLIDASRLILASPTMTLDGGGVVQLTGALNAAGTQRLINVDNTITGSGDINAAALALTNDAAGVISTGIDVGGAVVNAGLLENASIGFYTATTIQNVGAGRLLANGAGFGIYNADIIGGTLAAINGGNYQLGSVDDAAGNSVILDGSGAPVTIAAGVTITDFFDTFDASFTFNTSSGLSLLGVIDFHGTIIGPEPGRVLFGAVAVPNAGLLRGDGTVIGDLSNTGKVLAQGGTMTVTGDLDGSGSIAIAPGAAFALGGESGETINFLDAPNDRLILNAPSAYTGTLTNLTYGDVIDLGTLDIRSAVVTGNTLAVTMLDNSVIDYKLAGLPAGATFVPQSNQTPTETFDFTYVGGGTTLQPDYSASGTGYFTVRTGVGSSLTLADVTAFSLNLAVTNPTSGALSAGTDTIQYVLGNLANFSATLGAGGTLSTLSFSTGTSTGSDISFQEHVYPQSFDVAGLSSGGADSYNSFFGGPLTQGSIAVTPLGAVLSELVVRCFAEGTRIAVPGGERAVETLAVGDRVTVASGEPREIIWTGHRRIDLRRHPNPARVRPVRIAAGAFGPDCPRNDLLLSPDHAVFVNAVLIPVKYLINGTSIAQIDVDTVVYYHIELDTHDVVAAEGLPVETYLDTGDRAHFADGGAIGTPYQDFHALAWEARGFAPLIITGPELSAARRFIAACAGPETMAA